MEKIKSISEAYSQQPCSLQTSTLEKYENAKNDWIKDSMVKEIKLERLQVGTRCGDPVEELYYVGYGFAGQKLFQYIYNSVNVHYEAV
jgi:hypothetical protein